MGRINAGQSMEGSNVEKIEQNFQGGSSSRTTGSIQKRSFENGSQDVYPATIRAQSLVTWSYTIFAIPLVRKD